MQGVLIYLHGFLHSMLIWMILMLPTLLPSRFSLISYHYQIQLTPDILKSRTPTFFFQYKRISIQARFETFSHTTCFVYPTSNVEQKCVVRCQFIMFAILHCLNDEVDFINSFNVFI
jgi:hypothetical protein